MTGADRLPNETPENQVFSIETTIDATGKIDSSSDMDWIITSPGEVDDSPLGLHQATSLVRYQDNLQSNGGKISLNKNWDFSSKDQSVGLFNIESSKVLTYGSTEGSHLIGEEEYLEDNAGMMKETSDNIRCVFSNNVKILPPFCDIVKAKNNLINMNSAQVSTKGQIRSVASTDYIPAELNYLIAVTPDSNIKTGYADGAVKTIYSGSIMEGRGDGIDWQTFWFEPWPGHWESYQGGDYVPSHTNSWKDSTEAFGGIKTFQKAFNYKSGFRI